MNYVLKLFARYPIREISIFYLVMLVFVTIALSDGPYGDAAYRRMGIHDGNLIATIYFNQGDISGWHGWGYPPPRIEWPKGSGHEYGDENSLLIAAEVVDIYGDTIHIVSESSLDWDATDTDPITGQQLGWEPLPGYLNPDQDYPAMSHLPETWPDFWPDKMDYPDDPGWPGSWNGYFGRDMFLADQESYFVMDDNYNVEFEFYPDSMDSLRRGLGLRVAVRGLQWSDPLAEDCLFWLYDVTNVSTTTYTKVIMGQVFDARIGGLGEEYDDLADYDTILDMVYSWDIDGIGSGGWSPVGYLGFAFLETPGNAGDGLDNDDDGLIDESRDSSPGVWLDAYPYGVDDVQKFEYFYGRPPEPHWSGDEDGDWVGFSDVNENGLWDLGEPLNDDLGSDGIGPDHPSYSGPDVGEGDGIPTAGEPNFDATDKDEADQIGLTSFDAHIENSIYVRLDEITWSLLYPGHWNPPVSMPVNYEFFFGSGFFTLEPGQTERFSLALVLGWDEDDLFINKQTVQNIYNANFNFEQLAIIDQSTSLPNKISLFQNYPNPFNPLTTIEFEVRKKGWISLNIYNILGRSIDTLIDSEVEAGRHRITWDARDKPSGIYFYRLSTIGFEQTRKMLLLH